MSRRAWLAGLALLLTACATAVVPVAPSVVFDTAKSPRLPARLKYGLFVTTARLDDVEHGPFVLDTGAFALTLDTRLADRLGVTRPGHTVIRQLVRFGTVGAIEIGPVVFRRAEVSIVDLSAPAKTFGETLAGVLGYPLFAAAVVEVDYPRQTVTCFDPKTYRLPRGEWQPLVLNGWHAGISARFEAGVEGIFMVDTGSNHPGVHLKARFLERHPLLVLRDGGKSKSVRIGGVRETLVGRISWLEVGGRQFKGPAVTFDPPGDDDPLFDGTIGYGLLRDFVVVFNYPERKIAFLDP